MSESRPGAIVLRSFIDALTPDEAADKVIAWAGARESRTVAIVNVHSVTTASSNAEFRAAIAVADMATPDGMPVAWSLRHLGFPEQQRVDGPDLMIDVCARCERDGLPVYLYGSTEETLTLLSTALGERFPKLTIAGAVSPPFRPLSEEEDVEITTRIASSGAAVVFVGLGAPKQEQWMADHRGRIPAVMLGVGAAFDFHAGTVTRAPVWWQEHGLEWLYRLGQEPRRLWRRYLVTNTTFVCKITWQLITRRGRAT